MGTYGDDPRANPWPRLNIPAKSIEALVDSFVNMKEIIEILINRRQSNGFRAVLAREIIGDQDPNAAATTNPSYNINQSSSTLNIGSSDLAAYANGTFTSGETIVRIPITRPLVLPALWAGSFMRAYATPTSSCSVAAQRILPGGTIVSLGTIDFAAGVADGIFYTAAVTFDVGDDFALIGPNPADTTFGNLGFGLYSV